MNIVERINKEVSEMYLKNKSGVYRFLNLHREILYIGHTNNNLKRRLACHFTGLGILSKEQLSEVCYVEVCVMKNKIESRFLESYLISKYKPKLNTVSKNNDYDFSIISIDESKMEWENFNFRRL